MNAQSTHSTSNAVPLRDATIHLHPQDNVAIAKTDLEANTTLELDERQILLRQSIPTGHKVALREIAEGEPVYRYGQVIGFASRIILPGEHVHTHNLSLEIGHRLSQIAAQADRRSSIRVHPRPSAFQFSESKPCTFLGYRRTDGWAGTRNYIAVISTVNCSAHAAREIARHFTPERLAAFPNVDGVIALTHQSGCPIQYTMLERTMAGMARHPNVGGYILVGLGCETNQASRLTETYGLCDCDASRPGCSPGLVIQELGGIRKTVQAGVAAIEGMLPAVNAVQRTARPLSELTLALQCGGSDSWSGVTANPVVGLVSDEIVRQGGIIVLAETPEIYGAEHLLARRAASPEIGQKLLAQVRWWEAYAQKMGFQLDDNRSVGNEAGGLTTIYEKSLGAVAKAGSTPLTGVYDYAEPVTARGFVFMNSPGYDPVSVTGQVAGGCTLVLFTTGRGSVFGCKPAPSIKISATTALYERMVDDMDLNAGRVLEGADMEEVAAELLDLVIAVASGQPSKSEAQGVGESEFCPWNVEGTL
jgi:altronate hydrolase